MESIIRKVIKAMLKITANSEFRETHRISHKDFIRERKISFQTVIIFEMGMLQTSLDLELYNFSKIANLSEIKQFSTAAISKARDKVSFGAFRELLTQTQKLIPSTATFKNHTIIAVDGLVGELPNTPRLMEKYKASSRDKYPKFHAISAYDVLNCKFLDAEFMPAPANEILAAAKLLKSLGNMPNALFLFDRGFPSVSLIKALETEGHKFVMRVSPSFLKEVNDFGKGKARDKLIHIDYDKRRGQTNRVNSVSLPYSFDLRCVRIPLSNTTMEILVTNLSKAEFKTKDIGKLYEMRWDIEIGYNHLKNAIHIEEFMGIKENSIKQEFYASLIRYNLFMLFIKEADSINRAVKKNSKIGL